jgi:hypothetical protein
MGSKSGLSLPSPGGDSVALRNVHRRGAGTETADGGSDGDRSGLRREPVQHGAGRDDIPFELLVAFTRHLIRHTVNGDALYLAMRAAAGELKAPEKQVQAMIRAVLKEHTAHSVWPKDF